MLLKVVFIPKTHSWKLFEAEGKNTHLEHIEDLVFNNGYDGAVRAFEYLDAVKLAKTKGRPTATVTKDPSFAKQDPKDLLPRRYNPETGQMDIV